MKRASRWGRWVTLSLIVLFAASMLGSSGALASPSAAPRALATVTTADAPGVNAVVTWNGMNVASAPAVSSAISTDFSSTIDVHYTWTSSGSPYTISDARLQIFYFGFALGTRDILESNPVAATNGSFDMPWDPGVLQWILAGTYALTASLLSPNGTTQWSEQFYLHVTAPAAIGAALPIILLLIGLYEAYSLARSGRQAAISAAPARKNDDAPKASPPATDAGTGDAGAKGESPPPSGGSP